MQILNQLKCLGILGLFAVLNINFSIISMSEKETTVRKHTMLCLGDSYTIGESVSEEERFPNQAIQVLGKDNIPFSAPYIIAKTGWTSDELMHAISEAEPQIKGNVFDCVTLLIGVNNQYRDYDKKIYRKEFRDLLDIALKYAGGKKDHVFVISIPDWGVTPFGASDAKGRSPDHIGKEIDNYNGIAQEESQKDKVLYIDINPISKKAATDTSYTANDNLHPSGKMYGEWASLLAEKMKLVYAN